MHSDRASVSIVIAKQTLSDRYLTAEIQDQFYNDVDFATSSRSIVLLELNFCEFSLLNRSISSTK